MSELTDLQRALGSVPSGLFIVTAGQGPEATGFLASFVQQVSFEPPVVTVAVKKGRHAEELIRRGGAFAVAVLDEASKVLLAHFARGFEPGAPAFEGIDHAVDADGIPYPTAALASLSCRVVGEGDWGDHVVFAGQVHGARFRGGDDVEPSVHVRKNGLSY